MPPSRQWSCPACHVPLQREDIKNPPFDCPHCGVTVGFSSAYLLVWLLVGFLSSVVVVQSLGLKAYAALLWLPILVFCLINVVPLMGSMVAPLRVQSSSPPILSTYKGTLRLFITSWIASIIIVVVYGFLLGWLAFFLRAPRQDVMEATDIFSLPLGLINPRFMIRPDKSLAEVLGIVTANSYFYALGLTIVFKVVHGFISRSRVTQLGISGTTMNDDDELL